MAFIFINLVLSGPVSQRAAATVLRLFACWLNLTPMTTANKEAVAKELERTCLEMGPPAAVLSDEGAELKSQVGWIQERSDDAPANLRMGGDREYHEGHEEHEVRK